jgi:hypothetical protein
MSITSQDAILEPEIVETGKAVNQRQATYFVKELRSLGCGVEETATMLSLPPETVAALVTDRTIRTYKGRFNQCGPKTRAREIIGRGCLVGLINLHWLMINAKSEETRRKASVDFIELGLGKKMEPIFKDAADIEKLSLDQLAGILRESEAASQV